MLKRVVSASFSASLMVASLAAASFAASPAETSAAASSPQAAAKANPEGQSRKHAHREGRSPERIVQKLQKELSLTPEQTAKVREILARDAGPAGAGIPNATPGASAPNASGNDKAPPARRGERMARGAHGQGHGPLPFGPGMGKGWAAQMRAEKVDTAALNREWAASAAKQSEHRQARFAKMREKFVALHAVLTPEQRSKLADRMERRGKGKGMRPDKGLEKSPEKEGSADKRG